MRVLLTGVKWDKVGMIGSQLSRFLKSQNIEVVEFEGDIREEESYVKYYYQRFDFIIHLAARAGVLESFEKPEEYESINVEGTKNMLFFAHLKNIKILNASSSNAWEWWLNPYATTKKGCEWMADSMRFSVKSIGMRFHTVWPGRDDMLFKKIERGDVTYINTDHTRDFIHVLDLCEAIFTILQNFDQVHHEKRVVDIGTGTEVSVLDVVTKYWNHEFPFPELRTSTSKGERIHTKADIDYLIKLGWKPKRFILE